MPADVINLPVLSDELEDNFAGATERLLTVHFGVPEPPIQGTPEANQIIFRWEMPASMEDAATGFIGFEGTWHPGSLLTDSYRGPTSPYFTRGGRKPEPPDLNG